MSKRRTKKAQIPNRSGSRVGHEHCDAVIAELRTTIEELRATIVDLRQLVERQAVEIRDLRRRLDQNSSNSSRPPSSDPPHMPPRPRKPPSGRRPGGQPGHEGRSRLLLLREAVDEVVDYKPSSCLGCGYRLTGEDPSPRRHQVTEVPDPKARTTEHRFHSLGCSRCGEQTRAEWPSDVPPGAFGPRLEALVALLTGQYRLSKRNTREILSDCFGVTCALGSVKRIEETVSGALAAPVEEARRHVRGERAVHMDETSWRQANHKAWLWTAVTNTVAVFAIRLSRGAEVAKELLGEQFRGKLVTDRFSGYTWLDLKQRQICWAHLKRDFEKIVTLGGEIGEVGEGLQDVRRRIFDLWHRVRDGTLQRSTLQRYLVPLRADTKELLRQVADDCDVGKIAGMCQEILKVEPALWAFVRCEGVEPTNNHAERILRPAVIWRKTSFGTQSDQGSRYAERALSVVASLRLQGRSVLGFLTDAILAAREHRRAPSLLPSA